MKKQIFVQVNTLDAWQTRIWTNCFSPLVGRFVHSFIRKSVSGISFDCLPLFRSYSEYHERRSRHMCPQSDSDVRGYTDKTLVMKSKDGFGEKMSIGSNGVTIRAKNIVSFRRFRQRKLEKPLLFVVAESDGQPKSRICE